jgi:hypothetical protein
VSASCLRTNMGLRTRLFAQDDEYLGVAMATLPAIPSVRTESEGNGLLDSSSGSGCSEEVQVDSARIRVDRLDVIPIAQRGEPSVVAWRHDSTRRSARDREAPPDAVGRSLRGGCCPGSGCEGIRPFMQTPAG